MISVWGGIEDVPLRWIEIGPQQLAAISRVEIGDLATHVVDQDPKTTPRRSIHSVSFGPMGWRAMAMAEMVGAGRIWTRDQGKG